MRGSLLLLLVLLGLLATFARAEASQESLWSKVQGYVQQAARTAQEHFTTFRESQPVQKAREWISDTGEYLRETFRNQFKITRP